MCVWHCGLSVMNTEFESHDRIVFMWSKVPYCSESYGKLLNVLLPLTSLYQRKLIYEMKC